MGRSSRLRWIPMLLKAYVDAQVRQELRASRPSPVTGPTEQRGRTPASPGRTPKRTAAVTVSRSRSPALGGAAGPYQALVRELRETRARLARIEKLQTELEQMRRLLVDRAPSVATANTRAQSGEPQEAHTGKTNEGEPVNR